MNQNATPLGTLRTGQLLIAALTFGMVTFTGIAAVMSKTMASNPRSQNLDSTLLAALGGLAIMELIAYKLLVRPNIIRQARREAEGRDEIGRRAFLEQRYLTLIILAGALVEGVGLFGAVILMVSGQWAAIAAPALASIAMLLVIPTADRFDAFLREVSGP